MKKGLLEQLQEPKNVYKNIDLNNLEGLVTDLIENLEKEYKDSFKNTQQDLKLLNTYKTKEEFQKNLPNQLYYVGGIMITGKEGYINYLETLREKINGQ